MKSSVRWTAHLPKIPDKTHFKSQLGTAQQVLERLRTILDEDLKTSVVESSSKTVFETPCWAEYQAYLLGKQAYITQLKALLPNYEDIT